MAGSSNRATRRLGRACCWPSRSLSVLAALVVGAVFLSAIGLAPLAVYREILRVSYTTGYGIADTLVAASALILTGLAAAVAFRFKLYNIGGEGQLYVGAIAAAGVALWLGEGTSPAADDRRGAGRRRRRRDGLDRRSPPSRGRTSTPPRSSPRCC